MVLPPILGLIVISSKEAIANVDAFEERVGAAEASTSRFGKFGAAAMLAVGLSTVALAGRSVQMAADFQTSMTRLVTSAGETRANLGMISDGVLNLSVSTATTTDQMSKGMYTVESAGFHGAAGLTVLKAASEGARAEGADLTETSNALTSALTAYHLPAADAVAVTDQMVAAVGAGKMTMQDFSSSLAAVLPIAAAAKINFSQVAGAVATMTAQGMSAQQATQDLANTIGALQNPNAVAINEMQQLGLNSNQVSQDLGTKGLTGVLGELTQAITAKMGPSGLILMNAFNQSTSAAQDANTMLKRLPASIQSVAQGFLNGTVTTSQWRAAVKDLPADQANLAREFATTANRAGGFNALLRSGSPEAQTYTAALAKLTGGSTGLNTSLMLTGSNLATFQANTKTVADAAKGAGSDVNGWGEIQDTFNFRMQRFREVLETTGIRIGTALLPPLSALMGFVGSHIGLLEALAAVIGAALTVAAVKWAASLVQASIATTKQTAVLALQKIGLLGTAAAEGEATVAQEGLNLAMLASPVGLVVAGLALLVGGVVYLWTRVKSFRDFWVDAWHLISGGVSAAWAWAKKYFDLIVAGTGIGLIIDAATVLAKSWNAVWTGIGAAVAWVYNHTLKPIFDTIGSAIRGITSGISGISRVASSIGSFFGFDEGGWVPGAPGAPMLAVVHGGEYVLSADMIAGRAQIDPEATAAHVASLTGGGVGGTTPPTGAAAGGGGTFAPVYVVNNIAGSIMSERDLVAATQQGFLRLGNRRPAAYAGFRR
jgi:TP901 family phage tail tape measure protein